MTKNSKAPIGGQSSPNEVLGVPIKAEDYYRIIAEQVNDVILTLDLNLDFLFVSESVEYLLGYTASEFLTKKISDIVTPESEKIARNQFTAGVSREYTVSQHNPVGFELTLIRKDGSTVWAEITTTFLRDENDTIKAILGVIRDITERRNVAHALRESELQYRTLVEDSLEGISVAIGDPLQFVFVNPALAEILGYSVEEILAFDPLQIQEVIHPEDREDFFHGFQEGLAGRARPQRTTARVIRKDGNVVWLELSASVVDYKGTPAVRGTFIDITERKLTEQLLQDSEERFSALSDAVFEAIFITEKGICIGANRTAARMFGWKQEDFIGVFGNAIISEEDKETVKHNMLSEYEEPYEVTAVRKDGTHFPVEIQARMMDYQGKRIRVTAVKDISERKSAEDTLQHRENRYRTVLNSMHDLIFVYDKNNCYSQVYTNDEHLLFAPAEELIGKPVTEVMPPDMLETYLDNAERIRKEGGSHSYDYQTLVDGKPLWYTSIMSLHEDGDSIVSVARDITDRKIIELKLQESEEKFRSMTQTTPAAVFVRLDSKFVYANETAAKISGYPLEDLVGMNVSKLVHPDQHAMVQKLMNTRDQGDYDTFHFELKLVTKSGEIRWLDYWSSLIEYDGENASVATAIDITEKKLVDDALRTSQALLVEAQRIAHLGSWDWDVINDIDIWSEETLRIYGVDSEDFTPSYEKFLQLVHPEDRDAVRRAVQEALNDGKPYSIDHRIVRPDGTIRTVHEEGEVTYDDKGRPHRMLGTILDITHRIEAEELQKKSELMYRTFVQNFRGVAYQRHIDHYGPIFFHGTVEEITGYTADDFVKGKIKLTDIVDEDSLDVVIAEINNLRSIEGYIADAEYKIRTKDGEVRWIRDTAQSLQFGKDEDPVIQGVLVDITARKMAERSTQEARTRAEFFNDLMAHDLNNIHQGLMAALELLLTDSNLPSTVTELAENALSQVERSITLIRSVRKFSSIQSDLQPTRSMDLFDTYKDAIESIRHAFPNRQIEVNTILTPRKFKVIANDLLFDVFFNIFHNSVKFDTNEIVQLDVMAKHLDNEDAILIRIDDRGPGIIPSMKVSVLDRLERTQSTSSGIGLTLVNTIVGKFGGSIWIEDRVSGDISQGSSFVFKIPRG